MGGTGECFRAMAAASCGRSRCRASSCPRSLAAPRAQKTLPCCCPLADSAAMRAKGRPGAQVATHTSMSGVGPLLSQRGNAVLMKRSRNAVLMLILILVARTSPLSHEHHARHVCV